MTNVVLVNQRLPKHRPSWVAPPLGLLAIAGYLIHSGYDVRVFDMNLPGIDFQAVADAIAPDSIVGFSAFTPTFGAVTEMARALKRSAPRAVFVVGGYHATFCYREILTGDTPFDAVALGPGEVPMLGIVQAVEQGRDFTAVPGVACRQGGVVHVSPRVREPLPRGVFPARHLIDMQMYIKTGSSFSGSIQFSRGCTHNCYFCQVPKMEGRWEPRNPRDVADEVAEMIGRHSLKRFVFVDNHLTGHREVVEELCHQLMKFPDLRWSCDARIDAVDEKLLSLLHRAGCRSFFIGLESGSVSTLEQIGKPPDTTFIRDQIRLIRRMGFAANGSFIIGFPWEDEAAIRTTIQYAHELELSWREFSFATPLPGTRLERDLPKFGAAVCDPDYRHWDGQHSVMRLPRISRRRLVELYLEALGTGYEASLNMASPGGKADD